MSRDAIGFRLCPILGGRLAHPGFNAGAIDAQFARRDPRGEVWPIPINPGAVVSCRSGSYKLDRLSRGGIDSAYGFDIDRLDDDFRRDFTSLALARLCSFGKQLHGGHAQPDQALQQCKEEQRLHGANTPCDAFGSPAGRDGDCRGKTRQFHRLGFGALIASRVEPLPGFGGLRRERPAVGTAAPLAGLGGGVGVQIDDALFQLLPTAEIRVKMTARSGSQKAKRLRVPL